MSHARHRTDHQELERQPIYWFAIFERARAIGDHARVSQAQRELLACGIVMIDCPWLRTALPGHDRAMGVNHV